MGIVISTHLPPPVMIESTAVLKCVTHMLCWTCAIYFSAAASSENDHGSMNLASNTASVPSTMPSRVAAIQGMAECLTWRWTSATRRPAERVVAFYNKRGTCEQWIKEAKARSSGRMPNVRRQCGAAPASCARLQPRQFPAHAGDAGADQGLVADELEGEV